VDLLIGYNLLTKIGAIIGMSNDTLNFNCRTKLHYEEKLNFLEISQETTLLPLKNVYKKDILTSKFLQEKYSWHREFRVYKPRTRRYCQFRYLTQLYIEITQLTTFHKCFIIHISVNMVPIYMPHI